MDEPFDFEDYRPTRPPAPEDRAITAEEIEKLFTQLRGRTKNIIRHPYDPDNWARRAKTLSDLRYPELAVGDAHKAALLCQAHMRQLDERKDSDWRLGHRMGFWMLDPLPDRIDGSVRPSDCTGSQDDEIDEDEYHDRLEQYLGRLQCRVDKIEKENLYYSYTSDEGQMLRRIYPWMERRHRSRDDEVVKRLNRDFLANAANTEDDKPFCVVKRDAFGTGETDVLGVFAAKRMEESEVILIDETTTWGRNKASRRGDYQIMERQHVAGSPWQLIDGKIDLGWIRGEIPTQAGPVLLNCRLLLSTICDSVGITDHPLSHHLVARLTPTYNEDLIYRFDLLSDIVVPNQALQSFGIDIFANHNYDTWVLFTIQARTSNNSCGDLSAESLNPLFALFNHSCDPNVEWNSAAEDHRTILVRARRDIEEGEQVLVEYDQFMRDQPLETRRERYYRWLDAPCQCSRCLAEEEEAARTGMEGESDWDDLTEKVVFPEDLLKN